MPKFPVAVSPYDPVSTDDARLSDTRTPSTGSIVNDMVAEAASIAWSKINKSGAIASDIGAEAASAFLDALAGLISNGFLARTGDGTAASRTITGTANQVNVANGAGTSGNPTLSTPQDIATSSAPVFAGLKVGTLPTLVSSTAKIQAMEGSIRAWNTATLGAEIHTQSNAASVLSEAAATTGWTTTNCTLTADNTAPHSGSYSLKGEATASSSRMQYSFTAVVGAIYRISLWVKRGVHGATPSARIRNHAGLGTAVYTDANNETWTEYTLICVATATTASVYVYIGNNVGDTAWVDDVSIKQILGGELIGKLTGGAALGLAVDQAGNGILDGNLQVNGSIGGTIFQTAASDPQHVSAGSRPTGRVGELVYYNGKMYFCTNSSTPTWEKITSS